MKKNLSYPAFKVCALSPGQAIDRNMATQHVATLLGPTCCVHSTTVLRHVVTCWVLFTQIWKWSNSFEPTTPNNTQHVATHRNTEAKRTQHVAPNNVAICYVGNVVAIVSRAGALLLKENGFITANQQIGCTGYWKKLVCITKNKFSQCDFFGILARKYWSQTQFKTILTWDVQPSSFMSVILKVSNLIQIINLSKYGPSRCNNRKFI